MKKVECIIRPEYLKNLTDELLLAGIGGMTASEVKGFGREVTRPENYLFLPKTKIELYITDDQVQSIVAVIRRCCNDGKLGSGKIAIIPLEGCVRVRTGEKEEAALL
ncbi:MAG: P-II family nitrogen regulator [Candidatus Omnitrophota bacterium]|nr:P-II family nitrogen regulator [Candidatus Omnitrophota bacterium]